MRLAIAINGASDRLWIDLQLFRHVVGFCWCRPEYGRRWYHRAWFYHRRMGKPYAADGGGTSGEKR